MENFDLSALLPALTCNGQTVSAAAWDCTVVAAGETDAGRRTVREFTAPDGLLKIRVTMLAYRDFPAVRYIPEIIGCGDQDSALIEAFHSLDLTCPLPAAEAAVRATTGSQNHFLSVSGSGWYSRNALRHVYRSGCRIYKLS